MTQPVPTTTAVADAISAQLGNLTPDQALSVLHALNNINGGEAVGVIKRDPFTGHVAHRVLCNGVAQWIVTADDGGTWNDMASTLSAWTQLFPIAEGS